MFIPHKPEVGKSGCRLAGAGLMVAIAGLLASCGRPVGDLGRYPADTMHDEVMPFAGNLLADHVRHEPVSAFPYTDNETILRNAAQSMIDPPDAGDWKMATWSELQRTRLMSQDDQSADPAAYRQLLLSAKYASSETRYNRLIGDMQSDMARISPFARSARAVRLDDETRFEALDVPRPSIPEQVTNAYAREDENSKVIAWVWRAMRFRLKAYKLAIEELAIATPSARLAADAEAQWEALREAIEEADLGTQPVDRNAPGGHPHFKVGQPGRYLDVGPFDK